MISERSPPSAAAGESCGRSSSVAYIIGLRVLICTRASRRCTFYITRRCLKHLTSVDGIAVIELIVRIGYYITRRRGLIISLHSFVSVTGCRQSSGSIQNSLFSCSNVLTEPTKSASLQAARQGLAVLMASAVVVLKHETSTVRQSHNFISIVLTIGVVDYVTEVTSPLKFGSGPMSGRDATWGNIYGSCDFF